jgi:hypothetical protein
MTYNIWKRIVQQLITDEKLKQDIIDNLNKKDEEQKNLTSLAVASSTDLCNTSSLE